MTGRLDPAIFWVMSAYPAVSIAALALLASLPVNAQAIHYAPGTFAYSVTTVTKQTQVLGESKQGSTLTAEQRMSIQLTARARDTLRFRTTLDDYTLSADLPIQLPNVGKMKGMVVEGVMTAAGRVLHFTFHSPGASEADAKPVAENMSRFLVTLAPDAAQGKSWTDTTSSHDTNDGGDLLERTVTTTSVAGDTVYAGQKAWRIRRTTTVVLSGTTVQSGEPLEIAGQGAGSGDFFLSQRGVYLGASTVSSSTTTMKLPNGSAVTLTSEATSAIALVK